MSESFRTSWNFEQSEKLPTRQRAMAAVLVVLCCLALLMVLLFGRYIDPKPQNQPLYVSVSAIIDSVLCHNLVDRMQLYLKRRAKQPFPRMPNWLRQQATILAQPDPVQYRNILVNLAQGASAERLKAICYCLQAGLDNKNATVAFKLVESRAPKHTKIVTDVFVKGAYRRRDFTIQSQWIASPSDNESYWYWP